MELSYARNLSSLAPMIKSRVTRRARKTIPQEVRTALKLNAGDEIGYVIKDRRVLLVKIIPAAFDDPFANFWECNSEIDAQAYRDL